MSKDKAVLIVGGYGVVGKQIASLFRARHPDIPLMIAGRSKGKADEAARALGNAKGVALDVTRPGGVTAIADQLAVVITAVNDPDDYIMIETIRTGIPYVDITRWTARQRQSILLAALETITAPVVFSSSWMAGVAALASTKLAEKFKRVHSIDIDILYSLKDKAGPNSIEYIDQLGTPYDVFVDGKLVSVEPMTDAKAVTFPGGIKTKIYRFDTPDQMTLPIVLGAESVSARIGYDDSFSATFLAVLSRLGIWKILSLPMFTNVRRGLLYKPGEGGSHEINIDMRGIDTDGKVLQARGTLVDPQGQTHLTALGGIIQLERVLGLSGTKPPAGITFPEKHEAIDAAISTLKEGGVKIEFAYRAERT